jgi:hypothetical protein
MPHHEAFLLSEDRSEDLESNGEFDRGIIFGCGISNWDDESWNPSERSRNRKDIFEIERKWIITLSSHLPSDRRRSRSDEYIDFRKCRSEIISDEFTDTTCPFIVGIIKSTRKYIRSYHRASLWLLSQSF